MKELARYIVVCSRPDVCAAVQFIAPGSEPTTDGKMEGLNKAVILMKDTNAVGLTFCQLDMDNVHLVLITDAYFGNFRDYKSQLGFVILMADNTRVSNIVHYASASCKRVTRFVLEAELHAMVIGFD